MARRRSELADLDTRPSGEETPPPGPEPEQKPKRRGGRRFWFVLLAVIIGYVVYAYAFHATKVNFDQINDPTRQVRLSNIIRALAHPDLLTYETVDTNLDATFMSPCPAGGFTPPEAAAGPHITLSPTCVEPGGQLTVTGTNLDANRNGDISYIAGSGVTIHLGSFQTDDTGSFSTVVDTRERSSDEPQTIRAVTKITVGSLFHPKQVQTLDVNGNPITVTSPRLSKSAHDTWDKIIETVFLAFVATTIGTLIAVPLSFFAARNLMRDIAVPLTSLSVAMAFLIVGAGIGLVMLRLTRRLSEVFTDSGWIAALVLVILLGALWYALRWVLPSAEEESETRPLVARIVAGVLVAAGAVVALFLLAAVLTHVGDWLTDRLGSFAFLGKFARNIGDIIKLLTNAAAVLVTAFAFMFLGSRVGVAVRKRLSGSTVGIVNLAFAAVSGAAVAVVIAHGLGWLYEISDPVKTIWWPALVGGVLAALGAYFARKHETVRIGLTVYYIARTIFNAIRAIEPLVMVIVFVVWVGLGPFAGSIALALHTTAALAKLYSEQVESISLGPIEAVKATGATRMQTIVYAVAPQIVPPYISFTMYRWDINVRMSTIIGFAGGGGIGFLLQQNINLLLYRAAAVNMLAIAIVVASMDYLSSRLRERVV
jgi:ABC-type phosphate/phosphonate transport system permease subunit